MAVRNSGKDDEKIKKIVVDYNPYYLNTQVSFENIPTQRLTKTLQILELKNKEKKVFQLWIDKFLETLFIELNTDKFCIEFKGRLIDYEDIKIILSDYPNCELNFFEKYSDKNFKNNLLKRMSELEKIKEEYKLNIDTSKYSELFKDEIKIAVMAPMSSGKSTLINALLGNEILPAENIACTSKIFEIINNKHLSKGEYKARLVLDSQPISRWENVEKETLDNLQKTMDNGENINTKIELVGNFSFLSNENYNIKLIDTPGPNNDNNSDHRQESFNFIKNEKDCIILYVLDSTSLTTKDSGEYITEIARFLSENENEKELSDKIIFVLNKFDCASVSKGEDKRIYEDALMFLKNKGIKNPNIFPISSFFIKSLRKGLKNLDEEKMTEEESEEYDEFKKIENKFTRYNLDTLKFTPLPESLKKQLNAEKDEFKKLENLGGVTAIEYYIKRHISRYYLVHKMNFALTKILGDIKRELGIISLSFENSSNTIEKMKTQEKNKSEKMREIRNFLENYDEKNYNKKISTFYRRSLFMPVRDYTGNLTQKISKQINETEARNLYDDVEEFLALKYDLFETELKSIFGEVRKELEKEVIKKLKDYIDNFNQKDIFDNLLLDLKLELELDEVNKIEIKNKSEIKFKLFEWNTWCSIFTTKYSSEVVLGEIRSLIDKIIENHQKQTEERFLRNISMLKDNFQRVVEDIFEKISKSIEELEEKRNKLDNLKNLQSILANLLEKTENLTLLKELRTTSLEEEDNVNFDKSILKNELKEENKSIEIKSTSFVKKLLKEDIKEVKLEDESYENKTNTNTLGLNEVETSFKSFANKLSIKNLKENIPNLDVVENSLKNAMEETKKIVDDCSKIQVTKSFNKFKEKFANTIKK